MITITFPPGCYGHFVLTCLYCFTSLRRGELTFPELDSNGSSHQIRYNNTYIVGSTPLVDMQWTHPSAFVEEFDPTKHIPEKTLYLSPHKDHWLDYFINNYIKMNMSFDHMVQRNFGNEMLVKYKELETWQLREHVSFWIYDLLADTYSEDKMDVIAHRFKISALDLFDEEFKNIFPNLCEQLGVKFTNYNEFSEHHDRFMKAQKYHNLQHRCEEFIKASISNRYLDSPCVTIIDESYVQMRLRQLGYEIKCFGLNEFPKNSAEMHALLHLAN